MMIKDFIEELSWRGMLHDTTPGVREHLNEEQRRGYIGFDPTAPSMTIGNYVQIMILQLFQRCGHQPIVLMGGATGRIGDPSGKDAERELKSYQELDENLRFQVLQVRQLLDFDSGDNTAIILNNHDFYKDMNVLDFLRDVGKQLTVNYMLSKESVKKRLDTGLSFTEFSYQLLQAYDFLRLYEYHDCAVQMGGSDQWGNITSGTEFIRRCTDEGKAYAVTTPLLTKTDGSKFGKSEQGNIWLDPELTSPYQFYQFWINCDDRDISRFLRFFSLKARDEISAIEAQSESDPRAAKQTLAEELTTRIHSEEDYHNVLAVSQILFNRSSDADDVKSLSGKALAMIAREIPAPEIAKDKLVAGWNIIDLLSENGICASKGEARRAIQSNAVAINKVKVGSIEDMVGADALLEGTYVLVENGKKNKFILQAS
jgi:tyrosyl-tRNA synthetase